MDDRELPFTEHLEELRDRLVRCLVAVGVLMLATFVAKKPLFALLRAPMDQAFEIARLIDPSFPEIASKMSYKDPLEPFFTQFKVAILAAVFLAIPFISYQLWKFVAPGLYKHERRATLPFIVIATGMFATGASFCYLAVLPYGYGYLLTYGGAEYEPAIMMQEYLKLTARLLIAFGLVFELPVFIVFLARIGVVTPEGLARFRKHAAILVFVIAAILTPPDVITQVFLATPLVILYEVSIYGAKIFGKKRPEAPDSEP